MLMCALSKLAYIMAPQLKQHSPCNEADGIVVVLFLPRLASVISVSTRDMLAIGFVRLA